MAKRFTTSELEGEDGTLVLNEDGSIDYFDDDGNRENSWAPSDPDWEFQAIHFGLSRVDLKR